MHVAGIGFRRTQLLNIKATRTQDRALTRTYVFLFLSILKKKKKTVEGMGKMRNAYIIVIGISELTGNAKPSRYRPGVAQRVPGS